eukprot:CAMPEP_0181168100 /NCGR_PEP_ID=MMETSP1096-20121128/81_1 /TAXON_ID=156174 ORGANISM="Chrysochromulina ericina, Strain CCMP281" /NCGR_SAMPLE_ID=MMETSP1096 /ASSEMBLY_ACC=CAM_ASM_000453 /LENGTH=205 /DNA_ID=CAMNT_0023255429 /DNA_START=306 /DNA_END=924 /DNA_ORIENTATION=+
MRFRTRGQSAETTKVRQLPPFGFFIRCGDQMLRQRQATVSDDGNAESTTVRVTCALRAAAAARECLDHEPRRTADDQNNTSQQTLGSAHNIGTSTLLPSSTIENHTWRGHSRSTRWASASAKTRRTRAHPKGSTQQSVLQQARAADLIIAPSSHKPQHGPHDSIASRQAKSIDRQAQSINAMNINATSSKGDSTTMRKTAMELWK